MMSDGWHRRVNDVEPGQDAADEIGTIEAWLVNTTFELIARFADPSGATGLSIRTLKFVQGEGTWWWFPATG